MTSVTQSAAGASAPVTINLIKFTPGVGLLVTISGTLTADIQVSGDNVNWNKHDTLQGLTASANGNLAYPVAYIRINNTSYTSGSVVLNVIQALPN